MIKAIKFMWSIVFVVVLFWVGFMLADVHALQSGVLRLHIVANSDSQEDRQTKLTVQNAVVDYLSAEKMGSFSDIEAAKIYLEGQIEEIRNIVNNCLKTLNCGYRAKVTMAKDVFDTRQYETFSLPAGFYDSLQIELGNGDGENCWCVIFPSLCTPVSTAEFKDMAVSAGFDTGLVNTLSGENGYEVRFFVLDCLGKIGNFFRNGRTLSVNYGMFML